MRFSCLICALSACWVAACGGDEPATVDGDASFEGAADAPDTSLDALDTLDTLDALDAFETFDAPRPRDDEPPRIPIGLDAITMWDRWPDLQIGVRTSMRSTYDRTGNNGDSSNFIRQASVMSNVALDLEGPGVLAFVRHNHWHGSPWHYSVDGVDTVVTESTTADPTHAIANSIWSPADRFPHGLTQTFTDTRGADLSWVPVAFERSFTLAYEHTHYGTGYFIFQAFPEGATNLSRPLQSWTTSPDATGPELTAAVALLAHAGDDLAPNVDGMAKVDTTVDVPASGATTILDATDAPSTIRALRLTVTRAQAEALGRARLRATWDDRATPSIDAPIALFFGTGALFDRDDHEWLVRALPASVRFIPGDVGRSVELSMYFPMTFFRHAKLEIVGAGDALSAVGVEIRRERYTDSARWRGYFHATYRDHGVPTLGQDLVLLDTARDEGGDGTATWCGAIVGTAFTFTDRSNLGTLEGDPRFFFDDNRTPQVQGTGTEEWGGGGDYWENGLTMTLPLAGHPIGAQGGKEVSGLDKVHSAYRFLLGDRMPFGRSARVQLEHGGVDDSLEHYRSVTFWYGTPAACLAPTDDFHVGDSADELAHAYDSPAASAVESLTSRFELGADHVAGTETFPATTDSGRHTTGASTMTFTIAPENWGVLLRRTLDYAFFDQRADVEVADASDGATDRSFHRAGTWLLAGSNTYLALDVPGETDFATSPRAVVSNRRFRDDEFLIAPTLTRGRSKLRVRMTFKPTGNTFAPSIPAPPSAWSELHYRAYSWVLPPAP